MIDPFQCPKCGGGPISSIHKPAITDVLRCHVCYHVWDVLAERDSTGGAKSNRDPRVDPRPGDRVKKQNLVFIVASRNYRTVDVAVGIGENGKLQGSMELEEWKRELADAEVIAPETEPTRVIILETFYGRDRRMYVIPESDVSNPSEYWSLFPDGKIHDDRDDWFCQYLSFYVAVHVTPYWQDGVSRVMREYIRLMKDRHVAKTEAEHELIWKYPLKESSIGAWRGYEKMDLDLPFMRINVTRRMVYLAKLKDLAEQGHG